MPEAILDLVTDQTKESPTGGKRLIEEDLKRLEKIKQVGGGEYRLTEAKPGQLMVPPEIANQRASALEAELAQRQSADAAERARLAQEAEARRVAAEGRVKAAQAGRAHVGAAVGQQSQAVKEARGDLKKLTSAEDKLAKQQEILADVKSKQPSALQKAGQMTSGKVAAKALGVISGAATGMSAMEAIDRIKKGDYTGAVLPTLEAAFGVMSMLPPAHPVLLALRGLGNVGGSALLTYELGKAGKERFLDKPQE
jgi:hypothetical protein